MNRQNLIIAFACFVIVTLTILLFRAATCSAGWRAWVCYQISRIHCLVFSHCRPTNPCTYPENGPAIIVANHTSPVDPVLLWTRHFAQFTKPRIRVIGYMMAKEYYIRGGLLSWAFRAMESIPVERSGRDMAPIRDALRRLEQGHLLGLFPEGRINIKTPNEQLLPGGTGVAWLALRSKAPVIPVFIHKAPRSTSMVGAFFTWTRSTLTYGEPIDLSRWHNEKPSHLELIEVTDLIMQRLAELGGVRMTPTVSRSHIEEK